MSLSRFSLSSPFALFQSIVASDQEATNSSASSSSAINNSSTSLSLSPAANSQSASIFSDIQQQQQQQQRQQKRAFRFHNTSSSFVATETTKQISKHLLELQREIKEEEDEIFADINSLINNRSNLYSSFDLDDFNDNGVAFNGNSVVANSTTTSIKTDAAPQYTPTPATTTATTHAAESFTQYDDTNLDEQLLQQHKKQEHQYQQQKQQEQELEQQRQLELQEQLELHQQQQQQQQNDEHHQQQHKQQQQEQSFQEALQQQQRDIQELTSNLPKPCVFFLEGNCRRSDCKFSHDLSSIICKYWIEGFCFKGGMCPFSHSLTPREHDTDMLNDENRAHLNEKALDPTFVIESEADFPSLPLDAPANLAIQLGDGIQLKNSKQGALTKTTKNQILSSNPTVVFKTTKKKRKKG